MLQRASKTSIVTQVSRQTGSYTFVKAPGNAVLIADKTSDDPVKRATTFLASHGEVVGINAAERAGFAGRAGQGSNLQLLRTETDSAGEKHVKLDQFYRGLSVFGARLIVHMNGKGITGVNGDFVPQISVSTTPRLNTDVAGQRALGVVGKGNANSGLTIDKTELAIYPLGLLEGHAVQPLLAYSVEISGAETHEQVWLDANDGRVLNRISLRPDALFRIVYTPQFDPANPDMFAVRSEGDPPISPVPGQNSPPDNLYDFTGFAYNLYASAFGRDSFDGAGGIMRTVLLVNQQCPNAYWNGTCTNYCPDFDHDDVVCHEWSHAYTQYTHGLVYSYQSGALNESYSDIFGETIDLIDGVDGAGGNDNVNHAEYDPITGQRTGGGERFLIGEDVQGISNPALGILRDMYNPTAFGNPDKVSSENYSCGSGDGGGVHNNSGVPNHAYALTVDGGTFNGQTITGIGLTKAAAIWFRAESVYQTPTTNFAQHRTAIETSCGDLVGQPIYDLKTNTAARTVSGQTISAGDCTQVVKAMLATEMSNPIPCNFPPLLDPTTPPICDHSQTVFSENWESGSLPAGWTLESMGEHNNSGVITANPDWPGTNWIVRNNLPQNHPGYAAFALNSTGGTCQTGGDFSGRFSMISPSITVPTGANGLKLKFDHFIQTETGFDGGNLLVSVNGGAFAVVPQSNYIFNGPNRALNSATDVVNGQSTNPKAGQQAWTGSNQLDGTGSWGTTIVDLSSLAQPGDNIKLKYEFGQDGCGGSLGWFVDNILVFNCPVLPGPTLSVGADYENPDTDGSFTLNWTRPAGAIGPDVLQVSQTSCAPLLFDTADNTSQWTAANGPPTALIKPMWLSAPAGKPQHTNASFWANPVSEQETQNTFATLTHNNPIQIPATGTTTMKFSEWYFNEDDDRGYVEVSTDNGANWTAIYTNARSQGALPTDGASAFANEGMTPQALNLTPYSGQTIRLRFRFALGSSNVVLWTQYGWYVDDISIVNESWVDVAQINGTGTSFTDHKPSGSYCYQVRTTYLVGTDQVPSLFSNIVNVNVVAGVARITSRKAHGTAGAFDIDLPTTTGAGIECRRGGGVNSDTHQVVFHFAQPATFTSATVTPGPGKMAQVDSATTDGTEVLVNLKDVSNEQTLTVNLLGVNAGAGTTNISVPMGVLLGDTTGNRTVNASDISATKAQTGMPASGPEGANNFRNDVNANGTINSSDISLVKSKSGTGLP